MQCPQCKLALPEPVAICPRCRADLSLLTYLVNDVQMRFDRAEKHRLAGELGPAVRAYCDVLDRDPSHPQARDALGDVLFALRIVARFDSRRSHWNGYLGTMAAAVMATLIFAIGYWLGRFVQ